VIFSTNQIKELEGFTLQEKQQIVAEAMSKLTVPQKLVLNLIKLALLIPPFIYLARQEWGTLALTTAISVLGYLIVMKPVAFKFSANAIRAKVETLKKS
jgi:uncharacterized protein DUF6170